MPSNIRADLELLINDQRVLMTKAEANQKMIERLSNRVQKTCEERLKAFGARVLGNLQGGSATSTWEPSVIVCDHYNGTDTFAKIGDQWTWYRGYLGGEAYTHKFLKGPAAPFDTAALEAACAELAEALGIPVKFYEHPLVDKPESLRNVDDLLASMPGSALIAEGKIWHMGWDVADYWAIVREGGAYANEDTTSGVHVFYSTNGHGFGYDAHLEPGESRKGFLEYISSEGISVEMAQDIRALLEK